MTGIAFVLALPYIVVGFVMVALPLCLLFGTGGLWGSAFFWTLVFVAFVVFARYLK